MPGLFVKRHAEVMTDTFDVAVLHTFAVESPKKLYEIDITTEEKLFTVRVYYRKVKIPVPGFSPLIKFLRFLKAHQKGFREIQKHYGLPDLVHANILTRVGLIAFYLKARYGIPYIITEHWSRYLPENFAFTGTVRKIATRKVVKHSAAISVVSENLQMMMKQCGIIHPNFYIIKNVVDCNIFKPLEKPYSDPILFSHISCFDEKAKNVTGIIHAIFELSKHRKDFICQMVGEGEDKPKAEHLVEQLNLKDFVKFTGLLEGEALIKAYSRSAFIVLFSNYETMSVVIAESFACGRPVIATRVGGIPEIVDVSNGLLITPGDEHALSKAIDYMLSNSQKYNAEQIRSFAIGLFSRNAVQAQLTNLYQLALGK